MWDRVLDVNLKGTFLCSQAAARILIAQGRGGRIVNMVSRAAYTAYPRGAHYAASKAGILGFTRSLARRARLVPDHRQRDRARDRQHGDAAGRRCDR